MKSWEAFTLELSPIFSESSWLTDVHVELSMVGKLPECKAPIAAVSVDSLYSMI